MPTPKYALGIKGDECQCGRKNSIRHCPLCGSTRYYGYANEQLREYPNPKDPEGDSVWKKVKLYRCLQCANKFTDGEREFCGAPPIGNASALQRVQSLMEASPEGLTPEQQKASESLKAMLSQKPDGPPTKREAYQAFRREENRIINVYKDLCYAAEKEGRSYEQTQEEFVEHYLRQLKIERVEDPSKEE